MVAYYDDCDAALNPKTLTDWVRNFRLKRVQMRRKLRGAGSDLRVNAILSTALFQAELELRRKQQERFSRWLEMQTKFVPHGKTHCGSDASTKMEEEEAAEERREVESDLWKSELSGLDNFMRSLSGSSNNNSSSSHNGTHHHNNNHQGPAAITVHS